METLDHVPEENEFFIRESKIKVLQDLLSGVCLHCIIEGLKTKIKEESDLNLREELYYVLDFADGIEKLDARIGKLSLIC